MEYAIAIYVRLFIDEALYTTMKLIVQNNTQPFISSLSTSP